MCGWHESYGSETKTAADTKVAKTTTPKAIGKNRTSKTAAKSRKLAKV